MRQTECGGHWSGCARAPSTALQAMGTGTGTGTGTGMGTTMTMTMTMAMAMMMAVAMTTPTTKLMMGSRSAAAAGVATGAEAQVQLLRETTGQLTAAVMTTMLTVTAAVVRALRLRPAGVAIVTRRGCALLMLMRSSIALGLAAAEGEAEGRSAVCAFAAIAGLRLTLLPVLLAAALQRRRRSPLLAALSAALGSELPAAQPSLALPPLASMLPRWRQGSGFTSGWVQTDCLPPALPSLRRWTGRPGTAIPISTPVLICKVQVQAMEAGQAQPAVTLLLPHMVLLR